MGQAPQVRLRVASPATRPRLWRLVQRYLHELADRTGEPAATDSQGALLYLLFDRYWQEAGRHPLGVWYGSSLVGLCLLRDLGARRWQVAEFGIEPAYRRRGIGRAAVEAAAAWCAGQGVHQLEARVHVRNAPALAFWPAAGFLLRGAEQDWLLFERALAVGAADRQGERPDRGRRGRLPAAPCAG